jgi:hypothetical protein
MATSCRVLRAAALLGLVALTSETSRPTRQPVGVPRAIPAQLPLGFEKNTGQTHSRGKSLTRSSAHQIALRQNQGKI